MAGKRDIARESKKLANNENARLQITKTIRGYNIYRTYQNEWFEDSVDEKTIGFIKRPMTLVEVETWLNCCGYGR